MIKKIIKFFGTIIILLVLFAGFVLRDLNFRYANYFQIESKIKQLQNEISGNYFNERFGYEITYKMPWCVKSNYSFEMAIIKQTEKFSVRELDRCIQTEECNQELEAQLQNFRQGWTRDNSEIIVLSDLSKESGIDRGFVNFVLKKDSAINLPMGRWIQIFPTSLDPDLEKERLEGRIKTKTIILQNSLKAQQIDSRALDGGRLMVLVPHDFNSKLDSGEQAKSLNFITDAEVGSDSEKVFYEIVNSLSFR